MLIPRLEGCLSDLNLDVYSPPDMMSYLVVYPRLERCISDVYLDVEPPSRKMCIMYLSRCRSPVSRGVYQMSIFGKTSLCCDGEDEDGDEAEDNDDNDDDDADDDRVW